MAKQSRLEKEAIDLRKETLLKNDYGKENEYSTEHPDAQSGEKGKGVGVGEPYLLPDPLASKTSYKSTLITDKGGNTADINKRQEAQMINIYGPNNQYGPDSVDTSVNIEDGQYYFTVK